MEKNYIIDPDKMILRDYLAKDRTKLAMERTFLAYVRTALGFFSAGIACIKFINDNRIIYIIGYIMLIISPVILVIGISGYIKGLKNINAIPDIDATNNK